MVEFHGFVHETAIIFNPCNHSVLVLFFFVSVAYFPISVMAAVIGVISN